MTTIEQHKKTIENKSYNGVTTRFEGYIQFDHVYGKNHDLIAFTSDLIKKSVMLITNDNYLYSRQNNGYIDIYYKNDNSPTGVELAGGIPNELEFLLYSFGKTGQLSPTEDKRTAY